MWFWGKLHLSLSCSELGTPRRQGPLVKPPAGLLGGWAPDASVLVALDPQVSGGLLGPLGPQNRACPLLSWPGGGGGLPDTHLGSF